MRWERLFADLEARMSAAEREELAAEIAERTAAERATVELSARLLAHREHALVLHLADGRALRGTLRDGGASWLLVSSEGREALVPISAVVAVEGLTRPAVVLTEVERRMRISTALRELAEAGARVRVSAGASEVDGVILGVGADHLDVRRDDGRVATVALARVVAVGAL